MGRYLLTAVLLAAAGAALVAWWPHAPRFTGGPAVSAGAGATAPAPASSPGSTAQHGAPPVADGPASETAAAKADLPPGLDADEARRRRRLLELREAADNRFDDTVALDGLRSDQVQPSVRRMFDSLTLEPEFDLRDTMDGHVDGMRITELRARNPLARAGFRAGDVLTSLNGQPLVDPAQIAYTVISLGEEFEVCAQRPGGSFCRLVSVGPPS